MSDAVHGSCAILYARDSKVLGELLMRLPTPLPELMRELGFSDFEVAIALKAVDDLVAAGRQSAATCGNAASIASPHDLVSTETAGLMLGKSPRRMRQLAAAGDIPSSTTPRGYCFERADVVAYGESLGMDVQRVPEPEPSEATTPGPAADLSSSAVAG